MIKSRIIEPVFYCLLFGEQYFSDFMIIFYAALSKTATFCLLYKMKNLNRINLLRFIRGPEQIRTAVAAFAELSLATRPQDPFNFRNAKIQFFLYNYSFFLFYLIFI